MNSNVKMEKTRKEIKELIDKASDQKLIALHTREAIRTLGYAQRLCDDSPDIPEPWPSIVAYRQAHLIMRLCNDRKNHKKNEELKLLEKADAMFEKASSSSYLGPLPSIYRLSVLHRLNLLTGENHNDKIRFSYERAVDNFIDWTAGSSRSGNRNTGNLRRLAAISTDPDQEKAKRQLQNGIFNMLELTSYFMSLPYNILEGIGGLNYQDTIQGGWVVISPDPESTEVTIPKELAIEEMEERGKKDPGAVFFILEHDNNEYITERRWKHGQGEWEKAGSYEHLRLLALFCAMKNDIFNDLNKKFRIETGGNDIFRQNKARLKRDFCKLTKLSPDEVFVKNEKTPSGIPVVTRRLNIYGAVEKRVLNYR